MLPPPVSPHDGVAPGQCRWCGEDIHKASGRINFRAHWHKACQAEHDLAHYPDLMRKHIWKRDRGHCAECEQKTGLKGWAIHYVTRQAFDPEDITLWGADNIETLCWQCWKEEN